jgi:Tol biopolymer transport system component
MMRRRLRDAAVCAAATVAIMSAAVQLALRPADLAVLGGFRIPSATYPGIASGGGLLPLEPRFVARVLGVPVPTSSPGLPSVTAAGVVLPGAARAPGPPSVEDARRSPGVSPAAPLLDHPFTNDRFADAISIATTPFRATTDSRPATAEPGEPTSCSTVGGTAWYRYTAPTDGGVRADTFGTNYATTLGVFTGDSLSSLRSIGCDKGPTGNAQVGFAAAAGTTYYFQIGGAVGGTLVFGLSSIQTMTRANISSQGEESNQPAYGHGVSADGRYVVFYSWGSSLGKPPGCAGSCSVIYLRDRSSGATTPVVALPRATDTAPAYAPNSGGPDLWEPNLSADGRYLAFNSDAPLVPEDTNDTHDVYVADRATGHLERVSVAADGAQAETPPSNVNRRSPDRQAGSRHATISADGRFVLFTSDADNLVRGDTNDDEDVFVRDRVAGTTERVSIGPNGAQMARAAAEYGAALSPDGRFAVYRGALSHALAELPPPYPHTGDQTAQIYVRDRLLGTTTLASPSIDGGLGNGDSYFPSVSDDGRFVTFVSEASNLVAGDTNAEGCGAAGAGVQCGFDYFTFDRLAGVMARDSVSSSGDQQRFATDDTGLTQGFGGGPPRVSMSGDGRLVAFNSFADNLVPGDENGQQDVFVHDRLTGATICISMSWAGAPADGFSEAPTISRDGSMVAFASEATNLVPGDTNQTRDVFVYLL